MQIALQILVKKEVDIHLRCDSIINIEHESASWQ